MACELVPSETQTSTLDTSIDSIQFFLFSTHSEFSVTSSSPTSISGEIDNLNSQFRYQRLRRQKAEADKTLIQILRTFTTQQSEMVLDSLKRLRRVYSSCTSDFDEEIEDSVWKAFLNMRESQPDSPLILNLICRYADFLGEFAYRGRTISKGKLAIIADFLSYRGDRFLVSILSAFVDNLDGSIQLNVDAAEMLGDIATLLRSNTTSRRVRCWAYSQILALYSHRFPTQNKVSEKLLKLALLECIHERVSYNLRWCVRALHDGVAERNYESAEVIEVWFASSLAGDASTIGMSRAASLRQYYHEA